MTTESKKLQTVTLGKGIGSDGPFHNDFASVDTATFKAFMHDARIAHKQREALRTYHALVLNLQMGISAAQQSLALGIPPLEVLKRFLAVEESLNYGIALAEPFLED